jgi:hypothetical protein
MVQDIFFLGNNEGGSGETEFGEKFLPEPLYDKQQNRKPVKHRPN